MDNLTSRFLDAFAKIEKHLRKILDANKYTTFNEMIERAATRDKSVRRLRVKLKAFGDLRNFLVHEYNSEETVAFPSEQTVVHIEIIRDELLSPAKLTDLFRNPVATCSPADPIGLATKMMHDGSFSQLPVYSGVNLIGLLTSETVARWLAGQLADGQGILEERPVEEVMKYEEGTHTYAVMGRLATVDDALFEFDDHMHAGKMLDAIILTENGNKRERPLGIVTATDQPSFARRAECKLRRLDQEGIGTDVVAVSVIENDDIAGYDPAQDRDLYEFYLAEESYYQER